MLKPQRRSLYAGAGSVEMQRQNKDESRVHGRREKMAQLFGLRFNRTTTVDSPITKLRRTGREMLALGRSHQ